MAVSSLIHLNNRIEHEIVAAAPFCGVLVIIVGNGQETGVQSQVKSYQRLKKWYLMPPCLTLTLGSYLIMLSGAIQGKE